MRKMFTRLALFAMLLAMLTTAALADQQESPRLDPQVGIANNNGEPQPVVIFAATGSNIANIVRQNDNNEETVTQLACSNAAISGELTHLALSGDAQRAAVFCRHALAADLWQYFVTYGTTDGTDQDWHTLDITSKNWVTTGIEVAGLGEFTYILVKRDEGELGKSMLYIMSEETGVEERFTDSRNTSLQQRVDSVIWEQRVPVDTKVWAVFAEYDDHGQKVDDGKSDLPTGGQLINAHYLPISQTWLLTTWQTVDLYRGDPGQLTNPQPTCAEGVEPSQLVGTHERDGITYDVLLTNHDSFWCVDMIGGDGEQLETTHFTTDSLPLNAIQGNYGFAVIDGVLHWADAVGLIGSLDLDATD